MGAWELEDGKIAGGSNCNAEGGLERGNREHEGGGMEVCVEEGWSRGVWASWRGVRMGRVKRGVCTRDAWRCARVWGSMEDTAGGWREGGTGNKDGGRVW